LGEAGDFILAHLELLVGFLLAGAFAVKALLQRRSPAGAMAWLLIILLAPYVGVPLYLIFGGRKMQRKARRKAGVRLSQASLVDPDQAKDVDRLLRAYGSPGACRGNRVELLPTGESIHQALSELIDSAATHCWIATYILNPDHVGQDVIQRLARKARQGVDVRLLVDDVGSLGLSRRHVAPLIDAGGWYATFMPVLHLPFRGRTNLRNHRKIAVADGARVIAGGTNIASEYIGPTPEPGRWRDLSFFLEGPAAHHFAEVFAQDWAFATNEHLEAPPSPAPDRGEAVAQVVPSGPDVQGDPLYHAVLSSLFQARERILAVTPYFAPDETLSLALALAARRGVHTTLVLPRRSDSRLMDLVRATYLRQLMEAGGEVLLYAPSMLHAKALVVDDSVALVGSANLDMRSLFLNYETMLFLYSRPEVRAMREWALGLAQDAQPAVLRHVSRPREFAESAVRLLTPLM
jgi:cardiolipin synthase